ncbi:MAG: hypothetical protein U0167_14495 [bacterium]
MDDSWGKFWERLIIDAVAVLVVGFALQGLWFAAGAAVTGWRPDLTAGFQKASERFLAVWIAVLVVGLFAGVKRAWTAKHE